MSIKFWCEGCKGVDEDILELTDLSAQGINSFRLAVLRKARAI